MAGFIRNCGYASFGLLSTFLVTLAGHAYPIDDAADLQTQQAQEKLELNDMRKEMGGVRSTIDDAMNSLERASKQVELAKNAQQVHLIVKEAPWEIVPGTVVPAYTYNGQQPGPVIRLRQGEQVKIIVHNELKVPTSMYFHGMLLPHAINGLPRRAAGLIDPGKSYAFQFIAPASGTYWYHPQVTQCDQLTKGLYGAIVVDPAGARKSYDREEVFVFGSTTVPPKTAGGAKTTYFMVNGKSAPAIPALEVHNGERLRLHLINAAEEAFPLHLSGHKFEVIALNGSESIEPHTSRDSVTLQPGDRLDVEFTANNPGVWSLSSILPSQTSNNGKFPGGVAIVVRYPREIE